MRSVDDWKAAEGADRWDQAGWLSCGVSAQSADVIHSGMLGDTTATSPIWGAGRRDGFSKVLLAGSVCVA